jgi:hypothetical protein
MWKDEEEDIRKDWLTVSYKKRSSMAPRSVRFRTAIAEVKQCWSVIGWVIKHLLSRAPLCFGKHVKPFFPAAFAVVSTHQPALGPRGSSYV